MKVNTQPPGLVKPAKTITVITDGIVNGCIKDTPDIVTNYLRDERIMKTQRKQMHVRSLLNNALLKNKLCFIIYSYQHMANKQKLQLGSIQANKLIAELHENRDSSTQK